jgi:hypothetical protein
VDKPVGIVASDAGGANQIASHVLNNPGRFLYCLEGPAVHIFTNTIQNQRTSGIEEMLDSCSEVIAGTGWKTTFEVESIWLTKKRNIKVIAYLDHWTNYRERFVFRNSLVLPDEIWVSDIFAKEIAIRQFPQVEIVLQENFYIAGVVATYEELKEMESFRFAEGKLKILFLSEPAVIYQHSTGNQENLDEFAALGQLITLIAEQNERKTQIRVRLHPSERKDKFDRYSASGFIEISDNENIAIDFAWADLVVGLDTYAMYVASCLKIPTASIVLAEGYELTIPRQGIIDLRKTSFREFISEI